jgi:hypothetical protein
VAHREGKYSPVNLEYRQDRIVIEMSPHAGEEEGRGGISTWSSKLFYIFLLEDKRRWQLVRIETGKRRILFFIFDVVTK